MRPGRDGGRKESEMEFPVITCSIEFRQGDETGRAIVQRGPKGFLITFPEIQLSRWTWDSLKKRIDALIEAM